MKFVFGANNEAQHEQLTGTQQFFYLPLVIPLLVRVEHIGMCDLPSSCSENIKCQLENIQNDERAQNREIRETDREIP